MKLGFWKDFGKTLAIGNGLDTSKYWQRIRSLFGSSIIAYYLLNERSGTIMYDIGPNALHGTYINSPSLAELSGPYGDVAINLQGVNQRATFHSAAWNALFSGAAGGILGWIQVPTAVWEDGTLRTIFSVAVDGNNLVQLQKTTAAHALWWNFKAGGTASTHAMPANWLYSTGWLSFAFRWSKPNNRFNSYTNAYKNYLESVIGTWSGNLDATFTTMFSNAAAQLHKGGASNFIFLNQEPTEEQILTFVDLSTQTMPVVSILGDSISSIWNGWQNAVMGRYLNGNGILKNHAVAGASIINGLSAQVAAAVNDNATTIIVHIGTNDDNASNMTILQAEFEANISALKTSNPNAAIYIMGVLKRWTNNTVGPEVDKGNIRTMEAAAAAAQGVTYWDTYTSSWIAQNQTDDGLHPTTAAGHPAITTQTLARL